MKRLKQLLFISSIAFAIVSCKKTINLVPAASLNVVNASAGITGAKVKTPNVTAIYFNQIANVYYGSYRVYTIGGGSTNITIYSSADTTKPVYSKSVVVNEGDIYSLFLGGSAGEDVLLNKDVVPYIPDSSVGVRFINMSSNSTPLNLTLSTSPTNQFSSVAYKNITDFKPFDARSTAPPSYTFQVRDAGGALLASRSVSAVDNLQRNVTLVFSGMIGAIDNNAPRLFIVNNY